MHIRNCSFWGKEKVSLSEMCLIKGYTVVATKIFFLSVLRNTIWPGGVRPHHGNREGEELGEEEEEEGGVERVKMLRSVLVRSKLIGTVPDDLRRLLGSRRTTQGMARFDSITGYSVLGGVWPSYNVQWNLSLRT